MTWFFLFGLGALVGGQLNRGIYRLAILNKRSISPWSAPPSDDLVRYWYDRIPIFGWWTLRRESSLHGTGFWLRPLCIELVTALGFPAQYWWETNSGLIPPGLPVPAMSVLIASCASHLILFSLMIVAAMIDADEKTIPDEIAVTGTVVGLSIATILPQSLLHTDHSPLGAPPKIEPLWLAVSWPPWLNGTWGLVAGLACFLAWYYAILPKIWWTRGGFFKAIKLLVASLLRYACTVMTAALCFAGCALISMIWKLSGNVWQSLLTSLVGMAFGGGLVWAVRIIGTVALRREAMGFGDVTLMAMIGTFVGWQSSLIVFFLAPLAGLGLAVTQWVLTGRKDIAYGPFLCFASWILIEFWADIWFGFAMPVFATLDELVPLLVVFCLFLMHGMLTFWRLVSERFTRKES